jgi:hypothetical protein
MKIAICASMVFAEKMVQIKGQLEQLGHTVYISQFAEGYLGKAEKEKEQLAVNDKKEHDAILVLNYDRKGIRNYIGGNTLMEIGFAHVLNKKIFLMNPIPHIEYYRSEIEAVKPVILEQGLNKII